MKGGTILLSGGTVVDTAGTRRADVLVEDGMIVAAEPGLDVPRGARTLDAGNCYVMPALVDLHAHLREPGGEESETIETGARAAARGGYGAVVAMPNTDPPVDSAECVRYVLEKGAGALVEIATAGAITVGRQGERLAPMREMASLGVRIFTDDGAGVQDGLLMRRAMEYARPLGVTLAEHCEDARLAAGGHMHEGRWSATLGIPGIPAEAEEVMALRDIALARLTGCPLHILHVSTARTLEHVVAARASGVPVTCEVAPHHLALIDAEVAAYDPVFKVNPPLRSADHLSALLRGLVRGDVDAVATDHAPHPPQSKELPFDQAPPGMLGLETALAVVFTVLTTGSGLSSGTSGLQVVSVEDALQIVVSAMSVKPARIAGIQDRHGRQVVPGSPANLTVFDPGATWVVDRSRLSSLSVNTPWEGHKLNGDVRHTVAGGSAVVIDGEVVR